MNYFYIVFIPTLFTLFLLSKCLMFEKKRVYYRGRIDYLIADVIKEELGIVIRTNDLDNGFFDDVVEFTADASLLTELSNHYSKNEKIILICEKSVFKIPHVVSIIKVK